ncbi:MAG: outer membrane protein [Steroidobacteraceae bacterium]
MTKLASRSAALLALTSMAGVASAGNTYSWDGIYAGANAGGGANTTCSSWTLNGPAIDPTIAAMFSNRTCPNNDTFLGGVQIGDAFQYDRLVWAVEADFDAWSGKKYNRSLQYAGNTSPQGTYLFSGKLNPSGFGILGPRIGYAGDHWLPYLRGGAMITGGSHNSTLSYIPSGTTSTTASFSGGKNFTSFGWVAGGGIDVVLSGPWSVSAEYLHADLGHGSNSTTTCTGTASACEAFSGVSLESTHNSFTANIFRIGINYWFGY